MHLVTIHSDTSHLQHKQPHLNLYSAWFFCFLVFIFLLLCTVCVLRVVLMFWIHNLFIYSLISEDDSELVLIVNDLWPWPPPLCPHTTAVHLTHFSSFICFTNAASVALTRNLTEHPHSSCPRGDLRLQGHVTGFCSPSLWTQLWPGLDWTMSAQTWLLISEGHAFGTCLNVSSTVSDHCMMRASWSCKHWGVHRSTCPHQWPKTEPVSEEPVFSSQTTAEACSFIITWYRCVYWIISLFPWRLSWHQ